LNKFNFFKVISILLGVLFSLIVWAAIRTGHVSFGRRYARSVIYAAQNPADFWFGVAIYAAIAAFFFYVAFVRKKE